MTTPNAEALRQQNQILTDETRRLRARIDTYRANNREPVHPLLVDLAATLADAQEAAAPTLSIPTDTTNRSKPGSRPPGHVNRQAAQALRHLEDAINRAIGSYWTRRTQDWQRPPPVPKVRCVNRNCPRLDQRTPKHAYVGGSRIELLHCTTCGNRLTDT